MMQRSNSETSKVDRRKSKGSLIAQFGSQELFFKRAIWFGFHETIWLRAQVQPGL